MSKFINFWNENSNNKRLVVMVVCFQLSILIGVIGAVVG